jgi:hypothetical protein
VATFAGEGWLAAGSGGIRSAQPAEPLGAGEWFVAGDDEVRLTAGADRPAELLLVSIRWR